MKIVNLGVLLMDIWILSNYSLAFPSDPADFLMGIIIIIPFVMPIFLVSIILLNIGIIQYFRQRLMNTVALSGVLLMDISVASNILIRGIIVPQMAPGESGFGALWTLIPSTIMFLVSIVLLNIGAIQHFRQRLSGGPGGSAQLIEGSLLIIAGISWGIFFFLMRLGSGHEPYFVFISTMLRLVIPTIFVVLGLLLVILGRRSVAAP